MLFRSDWLLLDDGVRDDLLFVDWDWNLLVVIDRGWYGDWDFTVDGTVNAASVLVSDFFWEASCLA